MTATVTAGVFPGQGSQSVGMGRELADRFDIVRDSFAEANDVLGFDLTAICDEGPAEELKRTSIAQPALVMMSTAYWRVLINQGFSCSVVAGHSLGEYSALVAAGALTYPDALLLVRKRGQLMEAAAADNPGGMAAIIGMGDADVEALCAELSAEYGVLVPANYNSPGQVVVSGKSTAIAAVRSAAKARGARAIPLAVSGPFHSPLMQTAADAFVDELSRVTISAPMIPIVPNVTATPTSDPEAIRDALVRQITGSVRWVSSLYAMRDMGTQQFVEIGPGNVLTGLVQRTLPGVTANPVSEIL
ncbi:MAG TPA: ACP S-malonyltransferase [Armatimonadota bacterium]|nr:ACP S-malonyltransferase [Armatimonadota bacterium]